MRRRLLDQPGVADSARREWPFTAVTLLTLFVFAILPGAWPLASALADRAAWSAIPSEMGRIAQLFTVTVALAAGVLALSLPVGILLAVALFRLQVPGRMVWLLSLTAAAFSPLALYAGGWQALVGPQGFYQTASGPSASIGGMPAVMVIHAMAALPWVCGIVGLGLLLANRELEEESLLDASAGTVLWRVTLPQAIPAILFAALIAIVPVITDMTVADLFAVRTLAEETYTQFEIGDSASMTALLALPFSGALALLLGSLLARRDWQTGQSPSHARYRIDRSTWCVIPLAVATLVVFAIPIAGLVRQLGLENDPSGSRSRWSLAVAGFYLQQELVGGWRLLAIDLIQAAIAGVLTTLVAAVAAWRWVQGGRWTRQAGLFWIAWLLFLPGPILALGLIELFNRPDPLGLLGFLYDSPAVMILGQIVRALPVATMILISALVRLDWRLFDAARLEGANSCALLRAVALPAVAPWLVLGVLTSTALALTEMPATKLLAPPGADPLAPRVFHLLHTGTANQQAALLLVMWLLVVGFSAAVVLWWRHLSQNPVMAPEANEAKRGERR